MNFLKRAVLSVWGHKAKTIILFVAFAVIGSMLLSSLAIENSSEQVVNNAKESIGCKIKITCKPVSDDCKSVAKYPRIDSDFETNIIKINHVTFVNSWSERFLFPKNFEVPADEGADEQYTDSQGLLIAVTDTAKYSAFSTDSYKLIKGRHLAKSDNGKSNVIINRKVADANNINLGDKITVTLHPDEDANGKGACDSSYTVVGIFEAPVFAGWEDSSRKFNGLMFASKSRDYYRDFESIDLSELSKKYIEEAEEYVKNYNPDSNADDSSLEAYMKKEHYKYGKYLLEQIKAVPNYFPLNMDDQQESLTLEISVDSPENINYVLNQLERIDIKDRYQFDSCADEYNRIVVPIKSTKRLASLFTYIVFAAGLLIMALIVILSLKNRKHEFGILLAIGEKKVKILLQILTETIIPIAFSIIVAVAASGLISDFTAKKIVNDNFTPFDNVITMENLGEIQSREPSEFFNVKGVEQINEINVSVTPRDIGIFSGCSLFIVLLACGIPMIKIVKLSPMNVLTRKD